MKTRQRKVGLIVPCVVLLFGLCFLCVGVGTVAYACLRWHTFLRALSWQPVAATIQQADLQEHQGAEETAYTLEAWYAYEFKGRRYTSNSIDIMGGRSGDQPFLWRRCQDLKRHRDTGQPFTAYVNRQNPSESLLYREAHEPWLYALVPFGFFLTGCGACVMCLGGWVIRKRSQITTLNERDGGRLWHIRPDWQEGRIKASTARHLLLSWIMAIGVSMFASGAVIVMAAQGPRVVAWPVSGLLLLLAAFLLFQAGRGLATLLVYGTPVLYLSEVPVVPGRRVAAALRTARPLSAGRWELSLECFAPVRSQDTSEGPRRTELLQRLALLPGQRPTAGRGTWYGERLYRQELSALGEAKPDHTGALMLPIALELPKGAPETLLDPGFMVTWVLWAKARAFPVSFSASFELPVFAVPEDAIEEMDDAHR